MYICTYLQTLSCEKQQTLSCEKHMYICCTSVVHILYIFLACLYIFLATGIKKSAHPGKHRVCSSWFLLLDFFLTIYNSHAHIELRKRPKGQALFWENKLKMISE